MTIELDVEIQEVIDPRAARPILKNISFKVDRPGIVWIKAPNGGGKTVLSSVLSGRAFLPGNDLQVKGTIWLRTSRGELKAARDASVNRYIEEVALMPQKAGATFLALHHQDDLCFALEGRYSDLPGASRRAKDDVAISRIDSAIRNLNIGPHLTRRLGESSYGETRRVEFACTVSTYAPLVIMDEPFSGHDVRWQRVLAAWIVKQSRENEAIWVITSHYDPNHFDLELEPILTYELNPPTYDKKVFEGVASRAVERLRRFSVKQSPLEISDLEITWKRGTGSIVKLQEFRALPATITWLEGDNGSGKSTFAYYVAGLLNGDGRVRIIGNVKGGPFTQGVQAAPNEKVQLLLQDPYGSFVYPNVRQDLRSVGTMMGCLAEWKSLVSEIEETILDSWGRLDRRPLAYSYAQLKFLQFHLIPPSSQVVIFDEPLLGIGPDLYEITLSAIDQIAQTGRIVICTSYRDAAPVRQEDTRFSLVAQGNEP